jgi:hypothetical protein
MKQIHRLKWIALVALGTVAIATQDATLIRRALKAGTTETYKIENEIKQIVEIPSMGEQDMIMTTVATVSVKTNTVNAEKGTADIETTTKIEKAATDGSLAAMMGSQETKLPDPKTEKGTLDVRNRLVITKDPKAKAPAGRSGNPMSMMGMGMMATSAQSLLSLVELPEKPVKAGEEIAIALPGAASTAAAGMKDLKLSMKFVEEKDIEGKRVWVVSYTGSFALDMDTSKLPKQPNQQANPMGDVKVTGTGQITGDGLVDKASGQTLSNTMNVKNDLKVFLSQMGMEMPVRGTVVSKLTLVK